MRLQSRDPTYLDGVEFHKAEAPRGVGGLVPDQPNILEGMGAQSSNGCANLQGESRANDDNLTSNKILPQCLMSDQSDQFPCKF